MKKHVNDCKRIRRKTDYGTAAAAETSAAQTVCLVPMPTRPHHSIHACPLFGQTVLAGAEDGRKIEGEKDCPMSICISVSNLRCNDVPIGDTDQKLMLDAWWETEKVRGRTGRGTHLCGVFRCRWP